MSDERHIQELIRSLPGPEGEPAFRERLRAEFVAGTLGGDAAPDGDEDGRFVAPPPRRILPTRIVVLGLAVAASLVALFFVWPRGPEWNVVAVAGDGTVQVNGITYPSAEALQRMPRTLSPGVHVSVEGGTMLDLAVPGVISIQLAPGSELEVPGRVAEPGRAKYVGLVARGEVRFVTGPDFVGSRLDLDAPAAHVIVTGTTFAVITDSDTTCVCVLEGTVEMVSADGVSTAVEGGTRRTLRRETGQAHAEEILPMERMKLQMLRDAVLGEADADAAGNANGTGPGDGG